ncbi:CPBP family intramembrane glutamic endopeptidase [Flagellimonas sp. S3867]|uniref:CPBP family intramembrane glutamic endopeptidase n=1 Tax=Flagellimonas sp. S3867 TaxID=2768063 RepID=UPI001689AEE3
MRHQTTTKKIAFFETILVGAVYITLSNIAVAKDIFGATKWFNGFSEIESNVAGGFTTGAITQIILVIVLVSIPYFTDVRKSISTLFQPATTRGWRIALIILFIEVIVLYLGWIKEFDKLFDTSIFGISMSIIPSFDGITQEIIFRGYIILRLARSGVSQTGQIIVSGLLFASIHISYAAAPGQDLITMITASLIPMAGTFGLGAAWAFAFQQSEYKLMPVVVSHILVIALVQPWLAYTYAIG